MAVRHHIKVMVVDDDESVCSTIGLLLADNGYRPHTFCNGNDAILAMRDESFQIALIDLRMPDIDGVDLIRQMRQMDEHMSIIVMTAFPDLESATQTMRYGSCDYISKPFKQEEMVEALDRACHRLGLVYTSEKELNALIGRRIREERLGRNLTLRQLSDRTDLTTSQLSQVELGKNAASLWALARISNALGLQLSGLLSGL